MDFNPPPNLPFYLHHQSPNLPFYPHHRTNQDHHNQHFSEHDQKLIDEVIYLHSLWHRGPPNPFQPLHRYPPCFHLKPSSSTPIFKKKGKKNQKTRKTHVVSDKEWPVGPMPTCPSPPGSGWPPFRPNPGPRGTERVSEEEVARVSSLKLQLKGLEACIGLFKKNNGGGGGDEEEDDEEEEEDEEEYGDDCDEDFELMWKVFEGNDELRGYYEKKCWNGEFYCLVCGVIGGKFGRMYKNCLAVVQHSVSILRTKKKKVHRGYAHVVCKVLGWDINRLPSLPPPNGDVDKSLEKSCEGEANKQADGCDGNPNAVSAEANLAKANDCELKQKEVGNDVDLSSVSCTDEGCSSDKPVYTESERNTNPDGPETHNSMKKDGASASIEHGQSEQQNPSISNPINGGDDGVRQSSGNVARGVNELGMNVEAHQ